MTGVTKKFLNSKQTATVRATLVPPKSKTHKMIPSHQTME